MILYQPQLSFFQGEDDNYYLHAITFVDRVDLIANEYEAVPRKPNKKGIVKIELNALLEENLSKIETKCLNPIVHLVNLGKLLDEEIEAVQVSLYIKSPKKGNSRSSKPKRKKAGSSTSTKPTTSINTRPKPKSE